MALKWPDKDPDEQLDFSADWSRYLGTATLSTVTWKMRTVSNKRGLAQPLLTAYSTSALQTLTPWLLSK